MNELRIKTYADHTLSDVTATKVADGFENEINKASDYCTLILIYASIAQLGERKTEVLNVPGSISGRGTLIFLSNITVPYSKKDKNLAL